MGRRRGSPEGLQKDVLKALGGLDTLNRKSQADALRRSRVETVPPSTEPSEAIEPDSNPGYRSDAVLATLGVWEEEPDTQRFVSSGQVVAARPADRRAARRVTLEVPVLIRVDNEDIQGTSEDISISGIFVRIARLLQSGKRVYVRFDMPSGQIEARGVVVRFRTPARGLSGGIGLCFENMSDELLQCIETFCDSSTDSVR